MKTKCERTIIESATNTIKDLLKFAIVRNSHFKHLYIFIYLKKMSRNVGNILLVQFSKYLESFSMIWSGIIRYIWLKQFGLVFIETPGILVTLTRIGWIDTSCAHAQWVRTGYWRNSEWSVWPDPVWPTKHVESAYRISRGTYFEVWAELRLYEMCRPTSLQIKCVQYIVAKALH